MDTLLAARLQMTLSLVFHIVFAAIGIGLPLLMVIVEGLYLKTGRAHYRVLARTWSRVIGLLFAVGAVSGTALSLELGLLWPKYMALLGAVVGHIFGLEGYAFFIEAIFIGLYLYGWDRLSPRAHWLCGVVIAISGMMSGVLVLGVNAWMQQPVGFEYDGRNVLVSDPIAIFKQPLWFLMALHSTLACYIAVGFGVAGWYAWKLLKRPNDAAARSALSVAMMVGGVSAFLQPISGDIQAKYVFKTQPVKFAAMEGQFATERRAPLRLGGWPNEETRSTPYAIEIPGGLSFLATYDVNAEVPGLDRVPKADWPPIEITHLSFQIMVGCGVILLALTAWYGVAALRRRGRPLSRAMLWSLVVGAPLGFVGLEAGWFVTEVGRQPWIIQGVMRTRDAVTPATNVTHVLVAFALLYALLTLMVVVLLRKIAVMSLPSEADAGGSLEQSDRQG